MGQMQHHVLILVVCLFPEVGIIVNGHNHSRHLDAIGTHVLAIVSALKQLFAFFQHLFHHMEEFVHLLLVILIDDPAGMRGMFKG